MCMYVCVCVSVCLVLTEAEKVLDSPGPGVTVLRHHVGAGS